MPAHTETILASTLSPSFPMADDAARYAMAQLPTPLETSMGGYILMASEDVFCATQPVEGTLQDFLFADAITMESAHDRQLPQGYRYAGYYFHDMDRSAEIKRLRPSWTAQRIALIQSVPSAAAVVAAHSHSLQFFTGSSEGALVRFVSHMPPGAVMIAPPKEKGLSLPVERKPVENYVRELMGYGEVSVVVTSDIWAGWRGRLTAQWQAFTASPQTLVYQPYFSQVYPTAEGAMAFVHRLMLRRPKLQQMGFLLKNLSSGAFTATEPIEARPADFDPLRILLTDTDGGFYLPNNFYFEAFYVFAGAVSVPSTVQDPRLYARFVQPKTLANALYRKNLGKIAVSALYISLLDGAQLRYTFSGSTAESRLYNADQVPEHSVDNGLQAELDSGRLAGEAYVRRVATAGDLSVLKTSALWRTTGRLNAHWHRPAQRAFPGLSPVFVLADDAARYAHELIGSRREREYIGLILQNAQQRFIATLPQANPAGRFDLSRVFAVDSAGVPTELPEGLSLYGLYSSRARSETVGQTWEGVEAQVAAQMFMDTDIHRILALGTAIPMAYLSGSPDSLLAFQAFTAGPGTSLFELTAPGNGGSQLHQQLQARTQVPSGAVLELGLAGELRVVVGSALWGPAGKVESDWSPPHVLDRHGVPAQPELGPVFASAREAVAEACERGRRSYAIDACGLGFVLKHKTRDEFVATQTVPGEVLDRLYHASEFGAPALIESFAVHCVYYRASRLPRSLTGYAAWVARHFIGANDFYHALFDPQGVRRLNPLQDLTLYLSPLDGSLLEYRTGDEPSWLFQDDKGAVDPRALPAKLGLTLTEQAYVRHAARDGQLTVLTTSECWDEPGRVGAEWVPFAQINRRQLAPVFLSADDAARYAQTRMGYARDQVYGGLILRRTDGLFTATEPVAVNVEDFAPGWIRLDSLVDQSQFLGGSTAVARYHSRVPGQLPFALSDSERELYQNMWATDFLGAMLNQSPLEPHTSTGLEYLMCANGALLSVATQGGALERSLAGLLSVRAGAEPLDNSIERSLRDGTLQPREYIDRVARALVLRVVTGSGSWGHAGRVESWLTKWPGVTVDVPFSPIFVQMDDALQWVREQNDIRQVLSYGVVLKARHAEQYVASLTTLVDGEPLKLDRLLFNGAPPEGFELKGLYLCPPEQPEILPDSAVYRNFVSPTDLARTWGIRGSKKQGYLPVFLGCADGAWLQLEPSNGVPVGMDMNAAATDLARLSRGMLLPLAYVRQVAVGVPMTVLVTSATWSIKGRVTRDWMPRRTAPAIDPALTFGPVFSHPDDAARDARSRLGAGTSGEFMGLVLEDSAGTAFLAVWPQADKGIESYASQRLFLYESTFLSPPPLVPAYPAGFKLFAAHLFFKARAVVEGDSAEDRRVSEHFPSRQELGFYRNLLRVSEVSGGSCYLSTRQGALLNYQPGWTEREEQLFADGLLDPTPYPPAQWLARLASDGVLRILEPDDYWPRRGVLKVEWTKQNGEEVPRQSIQPGHPVRDEL